MIKRLLLSGCAISAAVPGVVFAQNAPQAEPAATPGQASASASDQSVTDEVVVTAQKRAENVQRVPLSVLALGGAQLEAVGVRSFTDLSHVAPTLTVAPSDQPVNNAIFIRGIGTYASSIAVEPSVAVQIDDVPALFAARAYQNLVDIERVEVLSGPQSTLYGKSASGGIINVVTRGRAKTFEGTANALVTNDREYGAAIGLAGPITDNLGYRVSGGYSYFDGNVRNLTRDEWVNGRRQYDLRGRLFWDISSKVSAEVGVNYSNQRFDCCVSTVTYLTPGTFILKDPRYPASASLSGIDIGPNNLKVRDDDPTLSRIRDFNQYLKLRFQLPGDGELLSISSHVNYDLHDTADQDRTDLPAARTIQGGYSKANGGTQELRYVSDASRPFRVVGGVFLSHVELTRDFLRGPVLSYANWRATSKQDVYAGFGQADWRVGRGLSFTGGLRYQHEDIGYTFQERNPAAPAFYSGDSSDGFWTYKLGVQEQITPDIMVFGSYSTGHKGETYDLTSGFNQARANRGPIGPETSKAWEGGVRAQGFDRRVTLNATAFSTSYKGLQSQGYDPILDQIYLINLADARTRGVESTLAVRATSAIRLSGSLAYTEATIRNAFNVSCYGGQTVAQGCVNGHQDITDKTLPNAPKWKGTAQIDLDQPIGSSAFDLIGTAFLSYQSKVNYSINQNPVTEAEGYALVNLSLGMRQRDKDYQVSIFVNNLFDKHYSASLTDIGNKYGVNPPTSIGVANFAARDERRYFGIRGSISY